MPRLSKTEAQAVGKARRTTTTASSVKPRRVRWLWPGRVPYGYLSLWSGTSGLGKSTFFCWLVAEITHGRLDGMAGPVDILIIASEDAREDMWVPRLMTAGANLDRVHFFDRPDDWNIRDGIELIEQAFAEHERELGVTGIALVFVDSVFEETPEAKGKESINSTDFIRQVLKPFNRLCREHGVAGLVSTHPPKSAGQTYAANVHASGAFVQLARVGLLFGFHPDDIDLSNDDDKRRVLLRPGEGSNIGQDPGALEFTIKGEYLKIEGELESVPRAVEVEPSDVTFRDLVADPKKDKQPTKKAQVRLMVEMQMRDNEWHPAMSKDLLAAGFSKSCVSEAIAGLVVHRQAPDNSSWWHKPGPAASQASFDEFWRKRAE
jgi:hypothetical protein